MSMQWRSEGLQRPGPNACIGAPPPPPRLVNPASAPGKKDRQAKKEKEKKKGLQHEKKSRETQGDQGP